ncbi:Low-density lipo receptor-related, partial [Paramuricea clavata]
INSNWSTAHFEELKFPRTAGTDHNRMAMCNSFHRLLFLWLYILCLCQYSSLVSGTTRDYFGAKRRLMRHLTNDSEIVREIRPARDNNTSVNIKVRIHLREIANVDEKNQLVQTTVWLRLDWNNPFLTWDPVEYGGV